MLLHCQKKSLYTQGLKKDLRPTSLTPCVSKVAKGFIVEDYVKPAVLNVIDHSKNGEIPNLSTTMARLCSVFQPFTMPFRNP